MIRLGTQNEVKAFNLFEHLIVLHVFLGSFVGAFSLSLQSSTGAEGPGQLVNQSDDSPHDTARKSTDIRSISQDKLPAVDVIRVNRVQPQEEREARDVEVPLSSEELHVHVVKHVGVQFGVFGLVSVRVLPHLTQGVCSRLQHRWINSSHF